MEPITVELSIVSFEKKEQGLFLVSFRYGLGSFLEELKITEGIVPYIEYSEKLQDILHSNVDEAKNMNRIVFQFYNGKGVELPIIVGDFF